VTYNILLRASAQACDVVQVERFFQEMEAAKIYPDRISYNGVIGAYGKTGDFVQMEKTLFVMRLRKHIKPDIVTSNTLIDSYGLAREYVKMEQVSVPLILFPANPALVLYSNSIDLLYPYETLLA